MVSVFWGVGGCDDIVFRVVLTFVCLSKYPIAYMCFRRYEGIDVYKGNAGEP